MRHCTAPLAATALLISLATAQAGPVFLTGHDPDFHAQPGAGSPGAPVLLKEGLSFATGGTYNSGAAHKFLWVESNLPVIGGHLRGADALPDIGLTAGVNYDVVDAAGLAGVNFSNYTAIAIASDFGGMLTKAEIDELNARKADIANFINAGGGLFASAECGSGFAACPALVDASTVLFGFLPVTVTSTATTAPYHVTPYGASLGLTDADMNDPTHNSFALIGGLNVVDTDAAGIPTTLAGVVDVNGTGFTPVPEPPSSALLGIGLLGLAVRHYRRARR